MDMIVILLGLVILLVLTLKKVPVVFAALVSVVFIAGCGYRDRGLYGRVCEFHKILMAYAHAWGGTVKADGRHRSGQGDSHLHH